MNHLFSLCKKASTSRIASVSQLLNRVTLRGFSRATFDEDGASTLEKAKLAALKEKRKIFLELQTGAPVQETLEPFMNPEKNLITRSDLSRWAKSLEKKGHHQIAVEIHMLLDNMADSMKLHNTTAKHLPKQQPTHCLGLNAIADVASLISPSVVKLTVPGFFGVEDKAESSGTGFLIDEFGTIMTCAHVVINTLLVDESSKLNVIVTFKDGKTLIGKTESYSVRFDIAIVKIEDYTLKIPHVDLGFSTTSFVGEWVVTVGNPLGRYPQSLTGGVVSYLNRRCWGKGDDWGKVIHFYIQTDCAVNRGNSGGPLVNLNGQIIGVICMRSAVRRLALAVPIDVACQVIKSFGYDFTSKGYVLDYFDSLGPIKVTEARGQERGFPAVVNAWREMNASRSVLAASIDDRLRNPLLAVARKDGNVEIEKAPVKTKKSKKEKRSRENVSEGEEKDELRSKKTQEHKKKTKKVKHNQED